MLPLKEYAKKIGVMFVDRVFITRLFAQSTRIAAASGVSRDGAFKVFEANCVVLATGGYSHIYLHTNNAPGITGDGQALAFELGLPLKDIEFVQFYPTALGKLGNRILLYELFVFQGGGVLKNALGEDILAKHHLSDPMTMTRDHLARAIMHEIREGLHIDGGVIMDLGALPEARVGQLRPLLPSGTPSDKKQFIVSPTTHFCMGGIVTDEKGETSVPGLFAAGEVCVGVHGANRLGGNALTEVFALGGIAGRNAAVKAKEMGPPEMPEEAIAKEKIRLEFPLSQAGRDPKALSRSLKEFMWIKAGIMRNASDLEEALGRIQELKGSSLKSSVNRPGDPVRHLELQNMLLVAEMVCRAALLRTESRGSHYRSEYPEEDNANWLKNIVIRKEDSRMRLDSVPVPTGAVKP